MIGDKIMKQLKIKTKNFILRPLKTTDAVYLAKHANNRKVSQLLAPIFPPPYLLSDAKKFIEINIQEMKK